MTGRGGSEGSRIPRLVEKLQNVEIIDVFCGGQFSMALSKDGKVYSWGKGEGWRLGHATDEHIRYPEIVEALQGNFICYIINRHFKIKVLQFLLFIQVCLCK